MTNSVKWISGDSTSRFILSVASEEVVSHVEVAERELLVFAARHGLIGMLVNSGAKEFGEQASYHHLAQRLRQRTMLEHLHRILTSLDRAGIRATVLKGPYVAGEYTNPNVRTFTDLDLLVPEESLEAALAVLAADEAVRSIPPKGPKADKRDIPLHDPSGAVFNLDLHWDLFSYSQLLGAAEGGTAWAWQHARFDPAHSLGPLWHLPPGPRICFLCTHALFDHRFRLILFRDLVELARAGVDWEAVIDFAEEFQLRSTTYVSLLIARRLLGAQVPESILKELRPRGPLIRLIEFLLPRIDFARFDGHKPHLLNLAIVLLHDQPSKQLALALRAPLAAPDWTRRAGWRPLRRRTSPAHRGIRPVVTVLVSSTRRRGAEVFGERLAKGMERLGWGARLTALTDGATDAVVEARVCSNRRSDDLGRLNLDVVWLLRRELREQRPSIIFANGSSTLQYSVAASIGLRPKPVLVYSSIGEPRYWTRTVRQRLGQAFLLAKADHIVAVSEESRRQLVDFLRLPEDKVSVAHTGVPESFFRIEALPNTYHTRLLYLGNLSREKDPETALRVMRDLEQQGCDAVLRFVGSGPLLDDMRRRARELAVSSVEFVGSVDDVRPHLAWADVLILTSETEGIPAAVIEAAAAGVPAVAFDVGGVSETIAHEQTGLLVPHRDQELFVGAVARLCQDDAARKAMGEKAREFAMGHFTIDEAVVRYLEILQSLLPRTRARRLRRQGIGTTT
jgi:glycosyltransferase involved in cell wall biosynthesis